MSTPKGDYKIKSGKCQKQQNYNIRETISQQKSLPIKEVCDKTKVPKKYSHDKECFMYKEENNDNKNS